MTQFHHRFSEIFQQLGLPDDIKSIESFLLDNSPLAPDIELENAPFWNDSQSAFVRDEILRDADWAVLIDQLDAALRHA